MSIEIGAVTLAEELEHLLGKQWEGEDIFSWPPELFAVCACLLESSGAYVRVLDSWPPDSLSVDDWIDQVEEAARTIRGRASAMLAGSSGDLASSDRVADLWKTVVKSRDIAINAIRKNLDLSAALVELVAIADEACAGFGVPAPLGEEESIVESELFEEAQIRLSEHGTLTSRFPTSRLYVLPKQHTPKSGITLRSLTHHLALFTGGEVQPAWSHQIHSHGNHLNLLVVPWPFVVYPSQFSEASCPSVKFATDFRCFSYGLLPKSAILSEGEGDNFAEWLEKLFQKAKSVCGRVDGIIFPEAALSPSDFVLVDEVALRFGAFVVAGVYGVAEASEDEIGCEAKPANEVWMAFGNDPVRGQRTLRQSKHHRWLLDRNQLEMYGLSGSLDPNRKWWENIPIDARDVNFISLHSQITICCLICEDLARQDPVAHLVRSVGPNLVIALLADGPQLAARWPARYATVLADDPGSSVLTVTSLGMTQLAEPPPGKQKSNAVMLWKDALGGLREICLEDDASAIVLNLWTKTEEEWSADCRSDGEVAASPLLGGVHQIKLS